MLGKYVCCPLSVIAGPEIFLYWRLIARASSNGKELAISMDVIRERERTPSRHLGRRREVAILQATTICIPEI
jgi:hypothetical protein